MNIVLAIIIGLLFGFILQKIGAANPQKIINMLRLKDLHLMKVILLGIGLSSLILFILASVGVVDSSHISIKSAYVGVIIGGAIFGLGWAISGFCPGTGIVGAGAGRKDALVFILGGLVGAGIFMGVYESLKDTFLFDSLGGKVTLAVTGSSKYEALTPDISGIIIAGVIAIVFIVIAWKLPEKLK
jgi:uncharacterized membrane protein YedE/YeeE